MKEERKAVTTTEEDQEERTDKEEATQREDLTNAPGALGASMQMLKDIFPHKNLGNVHRLLGPRNKPGG